MNYDDLDFSQESIDTEMEALEEELKSDDDTDIKTDMDSANEALAAAYLMDMCSEDDYEALAQSPEEMRNVSEMMNVAMERTIVRFDRKARLRHLSKQAELNAARAANDPLYKKLVKLWTMERAIEKKIHLRYQSKARSIAMKQIRNYAANGKKIAKPNPSTLSFKDKVSSKIAQKAVSNSKKMFSNGNKKVSPSK